MIRLATLVSNSPSEVEDIVMDAFEETARRLDELRSPGAYLRTAVINGARRRYRTQSRRQSIIEGNLITLAPRESTEGPEYLADVLASLPERDHTILVLVYYLGMTPAEVAETLDLPPGTVRSAIHRSLARLRTEVSA